MYRAVFFDLDGTLVPMEIDEFLKGYYTTLGRYVEIHGFERIPFLEALNFGIDAMINNSNGGASNDEAFWAVFPARIGASESELRALLEEFYEHDFGQVGQGLVPMEGARRAVEVLVEKGYPLGLTTMPLFPRSAVEWRLRWAGIDPHVFARITTYKNSASTKPWLSYFAENLAAFRLRGANVLMVGNNTVEDLAIQNLGADAFLVTDYMIDPIGYDLTTVKHGSLDEFAVWAETLPPCSRPAQGVTDDLIEYMDAEAALLQNACPEALVAQSKARQAARTESERLARNEAFNAVANIGRAPISAAVGSRA